MTATLGETYAASPIDTSGAGSASAEGPARSPRRARRQLTARLAHSAGGHRVVAAMVGVLAFVALAGALIQVVAG